MEYRIIQGVREGSHLLHIPSEDMLYVLKNKRKGTKEYICYQTILTAPKKKGINANDAQKCTARVRILSNGICERMSTGHTCHENHDRVRRDIEKTTNMKKAGQYLRDNYPEAAHRIPSRHIFQREITK